MSISAMLRFSVVFVLGYFHGFWWREIKDEKARLR